MELRKELQDSSTQHSNASDPANRSLQIFWLRRSPGRMDRAALTVRRGSRGHVPSFIGHEERAPGLERARRRRRSVMASLEDWTLPPALQPKPSDYAYDLDQALAAVVGLSAQAPADAFTAEVLGTERAGNGVLIRGDGLVLTIGYLIAEAESVWLTPSSGPAVPGHVLGYDQETGLGLVQALARLELPALSLGS